MTQLAVVFPGQGSQSVGMLLDIAEQYREVKDTFNEASQALGLDLWALASEGPASALDQTENTQPALLAGSMAVWRILTARSSHYTQAMLAGHSLGEYSALVAAGALDFSEAIRLVAARGRFMQAAVPSGVGAMAAIIGLDDTAVAELCKAAVLPSQVLSPANYNSVGQVVIAGHAESVANAIALAKDKGAKMAVPIPVSVPSHCELMRPAAEKLNEALADIHIKTPSQCVIGNAAVRAYETPEAIREGLVRQLYSPVRWVETVHAFQQSGITTIIECGAGKILTGLNKRIDKQLQLSSTADVSSLNTLLETSVGA